MTPHDTVLDRFFNAILAGDMMAVEAIYAPDAQIWHNTDNAVQDVAANLRTLAWVGRSIRDLRYEAIRRAPLDSGKVLQEHVLRGVAPNGQPLNVVACIVFTFDADGRISRLEEYLDSAQVAVLTA